MSTKQKQILVNLIILSAVLLSGLLMYSLKNLKSGKNSNSSKLENITIEIHKDCPNLR
jgi:hypothetical protein